MFPQPSGAAFRRSGVTVPTPHAECRCSPRRPESGARRRVLRKGELVSSQKTRIDVVEPAIRITDSRPGVRFSVSQPLMAFSETR
jgi:hypothetical protein